MAELSFPKNIVMVTDYGFGMLYAGPREAMLNAVFRQNCGCTADLASFLYILFSFPLGMGTFPKRDRLRLLP